MSTKAWVWMGFFIGSTVGTVFPLLFGVDLFSVWPEIGSVIGSILGIWAGYKLGKNFFE